MLKDIIIQNAYCQNGSAVYGDCTAINSTFINNNGTDKYGSLGGAIYGNCSLINSTFINNFVNGY